MTQKIILFAVVAIELVITSRWLEAQGISPRRQARAVATLLAWIWTAPNNVITIAWMFIYCRPTGEFWWKCGYLEVRVARLPMHAEGETLGRIILYSTDHPERIRAHERVHGRDASILGPFFLVAYPIASLIAWVQGKNFYRDNFFEVRARRIAAEVRS